MSWFTLIFVVLIFTLFAVAAWYLGKSGFLNLISAKLGGKLAGTIRESGTRHDPDLAFRRNLGIAETLIAAILLTTFLYVVLILIVIPRCSHLIFGSGNKLVTEVFDELGLELGDENYKVARSWLVDSKSTKRADFFLQKFTNSDDESLYEPKVRAVLASYLENESGNGDAFNALHKFVIELAGDSAVPDDAGAVAHTQRDKLLSDYLKAKLVPINLKPSTPFQLLTGMETYENGELQATKGGLNDAFRNNEGKKLLFDAVIERFSRRVSGYFRVRQMFYGPIQFFTIVLFLSAIMLLGGRAKLISIQNGVWDQRFAPYYSEASGESNGSFPEVVSVLSELPRESSELMPEESALEDVSYREQVLIEGFSSFLDRPNDRFLSHSFVVGALYHIYGHKMSRSDARNYLTELVRRTEEGIERVEYSFIEYLNWAMPSLGFIGTVVGISEALGNADLVVRAADQQSQAEAITAVTSTLGVAFDTTLIALVCTIPVMALLHWFRSSESAFLLDADQKITSSLLNK